MTQTPDPSDLGPPSPVTVNDILADRFLIGARYSVRGDVHLHHGTYDTERPSNTISDYPSVRIAAFRYRGAEPLPRFLEHLRLDAEEWGALRSSDGRLPQIVPTLDVGRMVNSTTCYWVQEDPRGVSLAEILDRPFAPRYALHLTLEIGAVLSLLHDVRLVHGDLDPMHVHLLGNLDTVRLSWGGLASRLESAGMDAGRGSHRSLAEVAPEVLQGRWWDPRSDLYALAALLYRMLAAQPPWLVRKRGPLPGVTEEEPLAPLPEWIQPELVDILSVALSRDPFRRPDLREWLARIAAADAQYAEIPPPPSAFSPSMSYGPEPVPPSLNRTLSPIERLDERDSALSNTPAPMSRTSLPPVLSGSAPGAPLRSLVPASPRVQAPPSLSPAPPPSRSAPEPATNLVLPLLAFGTLGFGIGMFLLALGWVAWVSRATAPPPQVSPPVAANVPQPAPAPVPPPPPVVQETAVFEVWSEPPGAELWENGVRIGKTPISVPLTGSMGDLPRQFELRLDGYATHTILQPFSQANVHGRYVLQRAQSRTGSEGTQQLPLKENRSP